LHIPSATPHSGASFDEPLSSYETGLSSSTSVFDATTVHQQVQSRDIGDVHVSGASIRDCFDLFLSKYSPQLPVVEGPLTPNTCYEESPYLFWVITTIGSRRYARDPTLLSQLSPQITALTREMTFSPEKSLRTIQAFMLLCTWPMPHSSLSLDITPTLSGVLLQHALSVGLHVFGVGQDFSRVKLQPDAEQMYLRARLWAQCIVVCQRSVLVTTP
jgi:transcriptional regulatory protein LEU3